MTDCLLLAMMSQMTPLISPKGDHRFFLLARKVSDLAVDGGRLASRSNASEALNNIFNARVQICSFILLELS